MAAQQEARQSVTLVVMRIGAAQTSQNVVGSISHLLRPPPFLQCSRKRRQSDCFIIGTTKGGGGGGKSPHSAKLLKFVQNSCGTDQRTNYVNKTGSAEARARQASRFGCRADTEPLRWCH